MVFPINFNDQLFMKTYKINNIILNDMLSPELMPINTFCLQYIPHNAFRFCRMAHVIISISP